MASSTSTRKAAVAGYFYPRGAQQLADEIDRMMEAARIAETPPGTMGRVLISPHAGYRYSGRVAAHGFRFVRGQDVHTVVVVSPSHVEYFGYSAVYDGPGYETPLGVATTSQGFSDRIASVNKLVIKSAHGHEQSQLARQEHALEVQIPFLQRTFGSFELVAVVMGDQSWDNCTALSEALAPVANDPGVLIVASTDLSHFHSSDEAGRLDGEFRRTLETLDAPALYDAVQSGRGEACGAGPVIASLLATESLPGRSCTALSQQNSGDASGDYSSVVGYLSAVITTRP
jgi:AmmeMemoRadiSam system protein B